MVKIIELIERFTRIISENIARKVDRKDFLKILFGGVFTSFMTVALKPSTVFGASFSWCETTLNTCG